MYDLTMTLIIIYLMAVFPLSLIGSLIYYFKTKNGKNLWKYWKIVLISFVVILVVSFVTMDDESNDIENDYSKSETQEENIEEPKESMEEYIASCQEYSYKDVLRNPEDYVGKRVKIRVQVSSVHEESMVNSTKYYFAYSNDEYDMWLGDRYGIMDNRDKEDDSWFKILEDDVIDVYGEIANPEQTKSLIVNSEEVFVIDMKYSKLISE